MSLRFKRILSFILSLSLIFSTTACTRTTSVSTTLQSSDITDPNPKIIEENIETENIETESILTEFITSEIYLEELVVAEEAISELLLEEDAINEVLLCKTIYVSQDNIEEFSKHSQTAQLFGDEIKITSLLKKISTGTGIIATLVILKIAKIPEPIASIVIAAADESLKFAGAGAAIGSLFGGLTGAIDEIDTSGRTSAVIGFATAVAGLIITIVSFASALPSAGATTPNALTGIKLIIAGISLIATSVMAVHAGQNVVKTFTSTDSVDVDWENINWERVGVSSAEQAIQYGADGYMWGAIFGAVHGGARGYDYYYKFNTPYTKYNDRLGNTPKDGHEGKWSGERGESDFVLDEPLRLSDGKLVSKILYKNAVPDFSPYQIAQVKIKKMTNKREDNFAKADEALAKYWTQIKYDGQTWTPRQIREYRINNMLSWHEMSNMESMQLIPREIHQKFVHYGGVAEYSAMIGVKEVNDFD